MSEHKLLPCPFCGSAAEIWSGVDDYGGTLPFQRVRCVGCNDVRMAMGGNEDQQPALAKRWNTRVGVAPTGRTLVDPDLVQRCKELLEWSATGLLNGGSGGSVRNLAAEWEPKVGDIQALNIAESKTRDEAMAALVRIATAHSPSTASSDEAVAWQVQLPDGRWANLPEDWSEAEHVAGVTYRGLCILPRRVPGTSLQSDETRRIVDKVRTMLAMGINIQGTGDTINGVVTGILEQMLAHVDELEADLNCAVAVGQMVAKQALPSAPVAWRWMFNGAWYFGETPPDRYPDAVPLYATPTPSAATNAEPVAGRLRMIKFVSSLRQHEIDLAVREELLKLIAAVSTAAPEPDAVTEARFLLDRLEELDDANDKDYVREFEGHVRPSISRLRHLLPRNEGKTHAG